MSQQNDPAWKAYKPPRPMMMFGPDGVTKIDMPKRQSDFEFYTEREADLDEEIQFCEANDIKSSDLEEYIDLLHKYNEYKDTAQMFMGQLAVLGGVMIRDVAKRLGAPDSKDEDEKK